MRPLKSHFPVHALTTLDTMLKQAKEARVFRRAQAVRAVVAGHHISTVSAWRILPCGNGCSALRRRGPRAYWIARAPGDRPRSRASWSSTSIASSIKTPSSMAPSRPSGVAANWRLS